MLKPFKPSKKYKYFSFFLLILGIALVVFLWMVFFSKGQKINRKAFPIWSLLEFWHWFLIEFRGNSIIFSINAIMYILRCLDRLTFDAIWNRSNIEIINRWSHSQWFWNTCKIRFPVSINKRRFSSIESTSQIILFENCVTHIFNKPFTSQWKKNSHSNFFYEFCFRVWKNAIRFRNISMEMLQIFFYHKKNKNFLVHFFFNICVCLFFI